MGLAGLALAGMAATPAFAAGQGAGSAATTVLRLSPGPRALALGGAMTAVRDPFAAEFNPAALSRAGTALSFQALPVEATAGAAAATFGVPVGTASVSLRFVDYGDVAVIEESPGGPVGEPTGATATGGELTALAAYGLAVGPVRLGIAGRWLRMDVAGLTGDAWSADAGALLEPVEWAAVGVAVQNLGSDVDAGRAAPLPRTLRLGARAERRLGPVDALLAVEGRRREERNGVGAGLEVGTGGPGFRAEARLGYESRADSGDAYSRFVFGGGVRIDRVAVDFAYRALGPLGSTRQFGLSYAF